METFTFEKDIPIICVDAVFPNGVMDAHHQLHTRLYASTERQYFGLTRPDGTGGHTLKNFADDIPLIGETFRNLLADPRIDPQGYCLEFYLNEHDMRCMVPLAAGKV